MASDCSVFLLHWPDRQNGANWFAVRTLGEVAAWTKWQMLEPEMCGWWALAWPSAALVRRRFVWQDLSGRDPPPPHAVSAHSDIVIEQSGRWLRMRGNVEVPLPACVVPDQVLETVNRGTRHWFRLWVEPTELVGPVADFWSPILVNECRALIDQLPDAAADCPPDLDDQALKKFLTFNPLALVAQQA